MSYIKGGQVTVAGLGTFQYVVQTTGTHYLSAVASEQPPSSLSIVIQQNGSTIASSASPAAAQKLVSVVINQPCTAGDVISFIISSSAPIDNALGAIKTTLMTRLGM